MNIEELTEKGDAFRHNKKYDEALQCYDSVLRINPKFVPSLIGRGLVLRTQKKYDEALTAFNKAIEFDHKSTKAWNSKGLVLRNLQKYDEALEAFETSIGIEPKSAFAWNGKGLVLLSLQKYDQAIEAYNTSLDNEPNPREVVFSWNGKGIAYANLRQFDKSIEAFNRSIKLDPKSAFALSGKATVFYSIGKSDYALKLLENSLEIDPKSSFAWNEKGLVLLSLEQLDNAIEAFEKSISYDPKFIPPYNNLSELYLNLGDLKKASSILDEAFIKGTNKDASLMLKGKIELEKQNYDSAIYYFKEAISQNPRNPLVLFWEVYAKYLKAEVSFGHDNKRYQDTLLSCIRVLEKINTYESSTKEVKYFSSTKKQVRKTVEWLLIKIRYILLKSKCNSNISIKLLTRINTLLLRRYRLEMKAYNKYFLGFFYYKLNDYFTAKNELTRCIKLSSGLKITNSAKQLVDDIWDYKLNTPICKWWLCSPRHSLRRRITLSFLLFSIFGILLPDFSYLSTLSLYLFISEFLLHFPPLYELFNSFLLLIFLSLLTILSFVDWTNSTTQYALFILLLFFFLIYPCIKSLRGSEVEIEMQSPQPFELTPGSIEKNLKELEKYLSL